jgi:hypothetical protein
MSWSTPVPDPDYDGLLTGEVEAALAPVSGELDTRALSAGERAHVQETCRGVIALAAHLHVAVETDSAFPRGVAISDLSAIIDTATAGRRLCQLYLGRAEPPDGPVAGYSGAI